MCKLAFDLLCTHKSGQSTCQHLQPCVVQKPDLHRSDVSVALREEENSVTKYRHLICEWRYLHMHGVNRSVGSTILSWNGTRIVLTRYPLFVCKRLTVWRLWSAGARRDCLHQRMGLAFSSFACTSFPFLIYERLLDRNGALDWYTYYTRSMDIRRLWSTCISSLFAHLHAPPWLLFSQVTFAVLHGFSLCCCAVMRLERFVTNILLCGFCWVCSLWHACRTYSFYAYHFCWYSRCFLPHGRHGCWCFLIHYVLV